MSRKKSNYNIRRPVTIGDKTVVTTSGGKIINAEEFEQLLLQLEAEEQLQLAEKEAAATQA